MPETDPTPKAASLSGKYRTGVPDGPVKVKPHKPPALVVAAFGGDPYSDGFRATSFRRRAWQVEVSSETWTSGRAVVLGELRFITAFLVFGGHHASPVGLGIAARMLVSLTGLSMTLFFVLYGFVVHSNSRPTIRRPGGLKAFFVARFYSLYIALLPLEFVYGFSIGYSACGHVGDAARARWREQTRRPRAVEVRDRVVAFVHSFGINDKGVSPMHSGRVQAIFQIFAISRTMDLKSAPVTIEYAHNIRWCR